MSAKPKIIAAIAVFSCLIVCLGLYLSQAQIDMTKYVVVVDPVKIAGNRTLHEVNGSITLCVPVAVKKDGTVHEVMNNLTVYCPDKTEYHPEVKIVNTRYGRVLKIVTDRYTVVKGYYSHRAPLLAPYDYVKPSTLVEHDDVEEVYIYLNSSGDASYVRLKLRIEGGACTEWGGKLGYIWHGAHYIWAFAGEYKNWIILREGWNCCPYMCMII